MFVLFVILSFITFSDSVSICSSDSCVCRYKNVDNQDFIGDDVQCTYSDSEILNRNYTLPLAVHSLDLSSNNLSKIQASMLLQSSTMVELLLNNNVITEISNTSFVLPELKRLDLSYNLLTYIDKETFRGNKKLVYLNLANNRFTVFSNLMFHHLSSLKEIVLNNNNIGKSLTRVNLFDRSGYGLTQNIASISISGINFEKVPENFFVDAYDLRKLVITNNSITDIFELPCSLEYLDLSDNPLSEIASDDFAYVPALKVLKLNNLLIKEVPDFAFEHLHSLKTLELARNRNLTEFSELAFGEEVLFDADDFVLEDLTLRGSRLTTLHQDLLEPLGRLITLDLQGNPWACDCNIKWVKQLQITPHYTDHLRCGTPPSLFNAKIFELQAKYFTCEKEPRRFGFLVVVVSLCIILAIVAVWMFLCLSTRQSRAALLKDMYMPSATYSALSVSSGYMDN